MTATLLLVSPVLVGIHAVVDRDPSVSLEAIPWMVKAAVQCVLQDCTLTVLVKVGAMIAKKDTCVVEESRIHVLKVHMLP